MKNQFPRLLAAMAVLAILPMFLPFEVAAQSHFSGQVSVSENQFGNLIKWQTSIEEPTVKYVIQRSQDGSQYTVIGETKRYPEIREENIYRFLDMTKGNQTAYYRVMAVNARGKFKYTEPVFFKRSAPAQAWVE